MLFSRIFITILGSLSLSLGQSQSFTVLNYSVAEGMPSSEIYEVFQDTKGFLWFATDNGVVRFDGDEIQKFGVEQGLTDPVVFNFFEDANGCIWFKSFSGELAYFENGTIREYKYNKKITDLMTTGSPNFIYDAVAKKLWFTFANMFGNIDSTGTVHREKIKGGDYILYKAVNDSYLLGLYRIYPGMIKSIIIDKKAFAIKDTDTKTPLIPSCGIRWKNKFYVTLKKDLYEYDGISVKKVFTGPNVIISLSRDAGDNLWIGYLHHGVHRFNSSDFSNGWAPSFLAKLSVTKMLEDPEKGLWFTTLEHGAFYVPNQHIQNFLLYPEGKIKNVLPYGATFLLADEAGGIYTFDSLTNKLVLQKKIGLAVLASFSHPNKNIWISFASGIYVLDPSLREKKIYPLLNANALVSDNEGIVWAYGSHSIKKFSPAGELILNQHLDQRYRAIHIQDSLLFLAARIGLHIRNKKLDLLQTPEAFSHYKISGFLKLTDKVLLITTIGSGFVLYDIQSQAYTSYNTQRNFIADNIYSVLKDGSSLWFATNKGVARTEVEALLRGRPAFEHLTKKSGLLSDKINFLLYNRDAIWAFSDEGFSRIPRSLSQFANKKPVFYFKDIYVNGGPKDLRDKKELAFHENNININFGYKSFNNQNIFTRYRLTEENAWSYALHKTLQLSALAPGQYQFEIQYSVDNIHWEKVNPIVFRIFPPLWQTWYFQAGIALLVLFIILLYFVNRARIYRRHQQKLVQSEIETIEQERSRIAKDLHDSVGTDFTAIKLRVSQVLKKHDEPQSTEIETQFQSTIQEIKSIIYGLAPPGLERYGLLSSVSNYVEKLKGTVPIKIEIHSFGKEVKDPKIGIAMFRIIQELISNSLKHSEATSIRLHLNSFEDLLNVVYEDNGKGFTWNHSKSGLGLYNIESRIQTLNGKIKFDTGSFGITYTIDIPVTSNTTDPSSS
jgi:signal transduction histidine kinase/ligand-binding sensor domain-containing protein